MATGVGLDIGPDESVAAVVTTDRDEPIYLRRESVLHMSDEGDAVLGGATPDGYHSIRGFLAGVGDPAGVPVDDREPYRAEDLVATALFCLINQAAEHLSGPAEFYAAHPDDWSSSDVAGLREALDYLGLRSVALVPKAAGATPADAALAAALAAHAAVLSTPAGATPPDPGSAENSQLDTTILPPIEAAQEARAYSAPPTSAKAYSATPPGPSPLAATQTWSPPADETPKPNSLPPALRNIPPVALVGGAAAVLALVGVGIGMIVGSASNPDGKSTAQTVIVITASSAPTTTTATPPAPPASMAPVAPIARPAPARPVAPKPVAPPITTPPPPPPAVTNTTVAPTTTTRPRSPFAPGPSHNWLESPLPPGMESMMPSTPGVQLNPNFTFEPDR